MKLMNYEQMQAEADSKIARLEKEANRQFWMMWKVFVAGMIAGLMIAFLIVYPQMKKLDDRATQVERAK